MKNAELAELKNNRSRYLAYVTAGGTVMVLDRDRPVVQIVPVSRRDARMGGDNARLARLECRGVIRRGAGGLPDRLGRRRPPRLRGSVLRDVLTERESGW